jgi:hypothetical protein
MSPTDMVCRFCGGETELRFGIGPRIHKRPRERGRSHVCPRTPELVTFAQFQAEQAAAEPAPNDNH